MAEIDVSQVRAFAAELGDLPAEKVKKARPIVSKGALNIKNELAADMAGSTYFHQIAPTINYDIEETSKGVSAEIGPDKRRRAARLAHFAYFGGANGGGGTRQDPKVALENEIPNFEKAIGDVFGEL